MPRGIFVTSIHIKNCRGGDGLIPKKKYYLQRYYIHTSAEVHSHESWDMRNIKTGSIARIRIQSMACKLTVHKRYFSYSCYLYLYYVLLEYIHHFIAGDM